MDTTTRALLEKTILEGMRRAELNGAAHPEIIAHYIAIGIGESERIEVQRKPGRQGVINTRFDNKR